MPSLQTFKFDAGFKQPLVLRPTRASAPTRLLLAGLKLASVLPTRLFSSRMTADTNERVVEVPFILQHLTDVEGLDVLDFGCTESPVPLYLASRGARVVGVDLRPYGFEHPNLRFLNGDLLQLNLPAASFDAVLSLSAVEHAGLDVYGSDIYDRGDFKVMREFHRLLRPGGRLLLTVPFGIATMTAGMRVYDSAGLDQLTDGWKVRVRELYRRHAAPSASSFWLPVSEEDAQSAVVDRVGGASAVALLECSPLATHAA